MSGRTDIIFALSSGSLPSGVAVIRLSGAGSIDIAHQMSGSTPVARRAFLKSIRRRNGELLDRGLVIVFPGPESFTGEDCVEFHSHGGKAVIAAILGELATFERCRPAEAGEFTRRAFLNGKIDLTEAESLADLISAETEMQRRIAVHGAKGETRALYDNWRLELIRIRAMLEADFDFSDEEDVPGSVSEGTIPAITALAREIQQYLDFSGAAEIIREGFRVVLAGVPNAGKSSLLNALAKRDVAIVTEQAGTTRDVIDVALDIRGYKVVLTDTAGIRESDDTVELIGIDRARVAARSADMVLMLVPPSGEIPDLGASLDQRILTVYTKADLTSKENSGLHISAHTGFGMENLVKRLGEELELLVGPSHPATAIRERHRYLLMNCLSCLDRCIQVGLDMELIAEELRSASDFLGRISGTVDVEDLLEVIFGEFCVGK